MKFLLTILLITTLTGCVTPRPWTKGEKVMLGASCLAAVADAYTTTRGLDKGCVEMNPIVGKNPSTGTIIMFTGITQALTIVVAHYWPEFRLWGLGFKTIVNSGAAVWNTTQY